MAPGILALALAACGGGNSETPPGTRSPSAANPNAPASPAPAAQNGDTDDGPLSKEITFIHTSDFHASLIPENHWRDGVNVKEGGLARVYSVIETLRRQRNNTFYVHSGDTISGGAEATFTRGQAIVDVVNEFGIDAFVPGNWEFGYGVDRFLDLFAGRKPSAPWGALAANAYYTGDKPFSNKVAGTRLLPAYRVATVGGVRIGLFACTTNRGPTIVSSNITQGVAFSSCNGTTINAGSAQEVVIEPEIPYFVQLLREHEKVDLVVLLSELGLAENIYNATRFDGIDIVFSSDTHESTPKPVVVTTPNGGQTLLIEQGEDGRQVGELRVGVANRRLSNWTFDAHLVDESVPEDDEIAERVADVRKTFLAGEDFVPGRWINPYNGVALRQPIDTVIGFTDIALNRENFSNASNPALIEGTGHDFLADAFRTMTGAQIGAIRGFRFTHTIPPGPITYEDIYHYIPLGPQVAVGELRGTQLDKHAEAAADSCMNPDVTAWAGGWMFNFSGLTFDLNPYADQDLTSIDAGRIRNYMLDVDGDGTGDTAIGDNASKSYFSYASYFYANDPGMVNRVTIDPDKAAGIRVLAKASDADTLQLLPAAQVSAQTRLDAVEVVAYYLAGLPNRTITAANTSFPRIKLTEPLPDTTAKLGFPVIEPLFGMDRSKY
jgi:2',3'-cyclic-nucleotide 2'-phosphodiesterase (5'-nucleotidase family)